jgi:hypothetical protein
MAVSLPTRQRNDNPHASSESRYPTISSPALGYAGGTAASANSYDLHEQPIYLAQALAARLAFHFE